MQPVQYASGQYANQGVVIKPELSGVPSPVIALVLLAPLFGISLIVLLVTWLQFQAASLTITAESISLRSGLVSTRFVEMLLKDIRAVDVQQGLIQRMMRRGNLRISSAARADAVITLPGVRCWEVKALIDNARRAAN